MGVLSAVASRRSLARLRVSLTLLTVAVLSLAMTRWAAAQPAPGEVVIAWHVTIAPSWFDPSTAPPQITPFGMLYALHDALVRPLPGQKMGNALAESWTESPDGLRYEFKLRRGLKFHNGDPVTTEDVKFSFERYKGAGSKELQAHVRQVEIVDPLTIRFHLKEPWPDFMTFYGTTATAAGLVVPKKYLTQVGDEGFRKHPIGAGPYRFVSHKPGVEVVLEAISRVLAPRALRQAGDHEERARGDHARGDAEERRGRHRLRPRRRGRREREAGPAAHAWCPRSTRRSTGSSSPTSGTRSLRGPTSGCGWPSTTRSTGRPSTRWRAWATARRRGSSSRA